MTDFNKLGAAQAARMIAEGTLTSEALVRACLDRIETRDAQVRAWVALDAAAALAQARERDRATTRGPLHGIPVGFKDVIDTVDLPTEYNSPIYKGHRPKIDAACVGLVKRAGGIVLGKTATTEFAYQHPPATRNPHNPEHTPGGSSSGSAASVGDSMVPLAFGTQTGGSNIRPSSYCGIVGYKPSFGTVNRAGLKFVAESLDTLGLMGRAVEDVALLVHAVAGVALPDLAAKPAGAPRVGLCRTPKWDQADAGTRAQIEQAARDLEKAGAKVTDYEYGPDFADIYEDHEVIIDHECARAFAWESANRADLLSASITAHIDKGWGFSRARYEAAMLNAVRYRARFEQAMADFDFLLTPSAPGEAPRGLSSTGNSIFNKTWTFLGVPCVTVPVFKGPTGLPIGIQVVGRYLQDTRTLAWADWVHRTLG
jgi:Asp-tRNA(Asn)/Glu-tRNA(Gln) amidotransferase A subunit family amidase